MLTTLTRSTYITEAGHLSACVGLSEADLTYMDHGKRVWINGTEHRLNCAMTTNTLVSQLLEAKRAGIPVQVSRPAWDTEQVVDLDLAQQALDECVIWDLEAPMPDAPMILCAAMPEAVIAASGAAESESEPE